MKFKKKDLYTVGGALLLLMIGIGLLSFPNIIVENINTLFYAIMYIYALIYFAVYFVTKEEGDYEYLFMALISTIAGTSGVIFNLESTPMVLSLTLIGWVSMAAIIKLIKVDYLMDRNNSMWYVKIVLFAAFILAGILTSINLYYSITIQTLMLGFFFLINGILEVAYPLLNVFHNRSIEMAEKKKEKEIELENKKEVEEISTKIKEPTVLAKTNSKTKKTITKKTTTSSPKKITSKKDSDSKKPKSKKPAVKKNISAKTTTTKKKSPVKKVNK